MYEQIATAVAAFCIAFLNNWLAREDLKKTERQKLVMDQLTLDNEALAWLATKLGHPDVALIVRVRAGASPLELKPDPRV